jgi:geranylgeranyl diphosphate synthase, type II
LHPQEVVKKRIAEINEALEGLLPAGGYPEILYASMRYSVFAGGKRLRPLLCLEAAQVTGLDYRKALPLASALEFIHTYSLIHDDLPALDNDDLRRGKPTSHCVYGEDIAILTGDALLTAAFEVMASLKKDASLPVEGILSALAEIAVAAGPKGMVGGQVVDLKSEGLDVGKEVLDYIHRHKTGALITASVRSGCLLAGGGGEILASLTHYAEKLGLAFQIIDDCLDESGDEKALGKRVGSDAAQKKATYPALMGREASLREAERLYAQAMDSLQPMGARAEVLRYLAHKLVHRDR